MGERIKLFQPSNSDHGYAFMSDHCYQCAKFPISEDAKNQCGIWMRTHAFSTSDPEYPREWCYVDGQPTCTAFKSREEFNAERRAHRKTACTKCDKTVDLFSSERQA